MKHLKLYESYNNFYTEISESEYESLITIKDIYCFNDNEIKEILKYKNCNIIDAKLYNLEGGFYLDRGGEQFDFIAHPNEIKNITIHKTNGSNSNLDIDDIIESKYRKIYQKIADHKILKNYTIVHITKEDNLISINKLGDEWYAAIEMTPDVIWTFYKCDQMDGLMKFLSR